MPYTKEDINKIISGAKEKMKQVQATSQEIQTLLEKAKREKMHQERDVRAQLHFDYYVFFVQYFLEALKERQTLLEQEIENLKLAAEYQEEYAADIRKDPDRFAEDKIDGQEYKEKLDESQRKMEKRIERIEMLMSPPRIRIDFRKDQAHFRGQAPEDSSILAYEDKLDNKYHYEVASGKYIESRDIIEIEFAHDSDLYSFGIVPGENENAYFMEFEEMLKELGYDCEIAKMFPGYQARPNGKIDLSTLQTILQQQLVQRVNGDIFRGR